MKINEFFYFFSIFKILFIAKNEYKYDQEWLLSKKKNDDLLNQVCINYLANLAISKRSQDSENLQKDLILLASLLRKQFKTRAFVSKYFNFIASIYLKSGIAVFLLYAQLLKFFIINLFAVPFEFEMDKDPVGKKFNFAIGFPEHSFNLKKNLTSFPSSFAEHLALNHVHGNNHYSTISLDGYQRRSVKKENHLPYSDSEILQLEVVSPRKRLTIKSILERSKHVFSILCQFRLKHIGLFMAESSYRMLVISHLIFIQKIKKNNQVIEVYILPYSEYLMLPFYKEIQDQVNVYYYSDNMLIPPASIFSDGLAQKKLNKFEDGNYSSFYGIKRTSGFVRVNNFLNRIAHDIFLRQENDRALMSNESPCMLGFEKLLRINGLSGNYVVSIFDVPPESTYQQFCRSATGDKISDFEFVSNFLGDLKIELLKSNIKFLYKPKYSLSNYCSEYRILIASLQELMVDKFIVLDPYIRIGDMIEKSDLVISFPYTSTKRFADFYGKKSIYYVPSKYANLFGAHSGCGIETIYGSRELMSFINNQT